MALRLVRLRAPPMSGTTPIRPRRSRTSRHLNVCRSGRCAPRGARKAARSRLGGIRFPRSEPKDSLPEVLRRLLQAGKVERVSLLDRGVRGSLAPAPVGQEPRGLEPVPIAPGLVAGDVPPKLGERPPVLADQFTGGPRKPFRPAARVAADWPGRKPRPVTPPVAPPLF